MALRKSFFTGFSGRYKIRKVFYSSIPLHIIRSAKYIRVYPTDSKDVPINLNNHREVTEGNCSSFGDYRENYVIIWNL